MRIEVQARRHSVDQPLAHERGFVASGPAIGAAGSLVGQPDMAGDAIGRHAIRPRQHSGREIRNGRAMRAHVGALIVEEFAVDRQDAAFRIDRGAHAIVLLARMVGGDEMLAPVLDPFHRPAEPQRGEADQHVLRIKLAADAEAAADMAFVEMHASRARGRACARCCRDSSARPWRRRAFRARRARDREWQRRRASPSARRNGGRRRHRVRPRHARRGTPLRRRHNPCAPRPLRSPGRVRILPAPHRPPAGQEAPRPRPQQDRQHPRRGTGRTRTRPRRARRHSGRDPLRELSGGRAQALRYASGENRSAECQRHRPRSTPPRRPATQAPRSRRSKRYGRAHARSAPHACEADAETKRQRQTGRCRSRAAGLRAA